MSHRTRNWLAVVVALGACARAPAAPHPLVGAWERIALTEPGEPPQSPMHTSFLIFSPDGFYSATNMDRGRPKLDRPTAELSRDELLARFASVVARRGRYTVSGDTVTRHIDAHSEPSLEGLADREAFSWRGDTLVLAGAAGREARYVRAH